MQGNAGGAFFSGEIRANLEIGNVSDVLANKMKAEYGVDLSHYRHVLNDNDIRHIFNRHGPHTKEKYPITENDLKGIPRIIKNANEVYFVARLDGKKGIYYEYRHNGVTYYLEQVADSNQTLQNKQMIKVASGTVPDIAGLKNAIVQKKKRSPRSE